MASSVMTPNIEAYYAGYFLVTCVVSFFLFVLYSIATKRPASARIQKQGRSPFLGHLPMEFGYFVLTPIGNTAARLGLSPNFFSWMCLILGFVASYYAALGALFWAGTIAIVSSLFDSLDGMVARKRGVANDGGEVLDAAIDRYTELFFLGALTVYYRFDVGLMLLSLFTLSGAFLVSYSQAKAEALQTPIPKGFMRRPERALYLFGGAFLSPLANHFIATVGSLDAVRVYQIHPLMLVSLTMVGFLTHYTALIRFYALYQALKSKPSA